MSDPRARQLPAPEMIRFRDALAGAYAQHPPLHELSIAAARRVAEAVRAPWAAGGPIMHETREKAVRMDGLALRLRVHLPTPRPDGMLVYVHGGGWTLFSLDSHDRLIREYAARANLAVIGIDYSLVPEATFPLPVQEVSALLRLLGRTKAASRLGFETAGLKLAVGGDSAGANLALAASLTLRDAGEAAHLHGIVLNYAAVDPDEDRPSYRLYGGPDYNLTREEMRGFWGGYAPDPAARLSPYASLLRGPLQGLPPTLVVIAECDVLRDENLSFLQPRSTLQLSRDLKDRPSSSPGAMARSRSCTKSIRPWARRVRRLVGAVRTRQVQTAPHDRRPEDISSGTPCIGDVPTNDRPTKDCGAAMVFPLV